MPTRPSSGLGSELEQLAFRIGIKPALRTWVSTRRASGLVQGLERRGVAVARSVELDGKVVLYVGRDRARVEALRAAEAIVLPGRGAPSEEGLAAHRTLGRLLGYPRCCVDAYLARVARGVHLRADGTRAAEVVVALEDAASRSDSRLGRLNVVAPGHRALVPFYPCRLDCEYAARFASALYDALRLRDVAAAEALRAALVAPLHLDVDGTEWRAPEPAVLTLTFDRF